MDEWEGGGVGGWVGERVGACKAVWVGVRVGGGMGERVGGWWLTEGVGDDEESEELGVAHSWVQH